MQTLVARVSWQVVLTRQAEKDQKKLKGGALHHKAQALLSVLADNPYANPPPYEKLFGDLKGAYSRRINIQHRLVYQVLDQARILKVIRMWTHYE